MRKWLPIKVAIMLQFHLSLVTYQITLVFPHLRASFTIFGYMQLPKEGESSILTLVQRHDFQNTDCFASVLLL